MLTPLTPGPYRFLFNVKESRKPSPASFFSAPRRPPDTGASVAVPPAVDCRLVLRKRTVLSARNSLVFRHPSSVRIPPPSSTFTLRPQEEVVGARKPIPIPARLPNQTKVRTQGKPRGAIEEEDQVVTQRQEDKKSPLLSSGYPYPGPWRPGETLVASGTALGP
ncbi:hypothetical protein P7K49_000609 [Saguinus oedipus]|uniref:Uncharacterized protein n=1 Tax=Saguinus oedipus TaxID=9490 RepID=A0ABQ9WC69_SAGOE|nr:hypothetical protein P7K49_000609 [Saguinus oedipus]